MIQLDNLILNLKVMTSDDPAFDDKQKNELIAILERAPIDKIPEIQGGMKTINNPLNLIKQMTNMKTIGKYLHKFELKYVEYGGSKEKLEIIAKQTEDAMKGIIKSMAGI